LTDASYTARLGLTIPRSLLARPDGATSAAPRRS